MTGVPVDKKELELRLAAANIRIEVLEAALREIVDGRWFYEPNDLIHPQQIAGRALEGK